MEVELMPVVWTPDPDLGLRTGPRPSAPRAMFNALVSPTLAIWHWCRIGRPRWRRKVLSVLLALAVGATLAIVAVTKQNLSNTSQLIIAAGAVLSVSVFGASSVWRVSDGGEWWLRLLVTVMAFIGMLPYGVLAVGGVVTAALLAFVIAIIYIASAAIRWMYDNSSQKRERDRRRHDRHNRRRSKHKDDTPKRLPWSLSYGDVIWALVPFEDDDPDEDGRTEKVRPVMVLESNTDTGELVALYMTSKVSKYRGQEGYVEVVGDWARSKGASIVDTSRKLNLTSGDLRYPGGRMSVRNQRQVASALKVKGPTVLR